MAQQLTTSSLLANSLTSTDSSATISSTTSSSSSVSTTSTTSTTSTPSFPAVTDAAGGSSTVASTGISVIDTAHTISTSTHKTSSATSVASSDNSSAKKSISTSEAVGIGIGTFVVGIVLALLAGLIFMKVSRKRRDRRHRTKSSDVAPYSDEAAVQSHGNGKSAVPVGLGEVLLEDASDGEMKRDFAGLCDQIEFHVDNNYHSTSVKPMTDVASKLAACGYDGKTMVSPANLGLLIEDPKTRRPAIYHLIAAVIIARISPAAGIQVSLLPPVISRMLAGMPAVEASAVDQNAFDKIFSKWRSMTAFLLQSTRSNRSRLLPKEADLQPSIDRNIALLDAVLQRFIGPGTEAKQRQESNLRAILFEGAKLGLTIFSQPTTWDFDWKRAPSRSNEKSQASRKDAAGSQFVVFPALVKVNDQEGGRMKGGKVVVDAHTINW